MNSGQLIDAAKELLSNEYDVCGNNVSLLFSYTYMGFPTTDLRRAGDWDRDGWENLPADHFWAPFETSESDAWTDLCPLLTSDEVLFSHQDSDIISVGDIYLSDRRGDDCDNCPYEYNPFQEDWNQDGVGDACDGGVIHQNHSVQDVTVIEHPSAQNPLPLAIPMIAGDIHMRVWANIKTVSGGEDVLVWLETVEDTEIAPVLLETGPSGVVSERRIFLPEPSSYSFQLRLEGPADAEVLVHRLDLIDPRAPYQVGYLYEDAEEWLAPLYWDDDIQQSFLGIFDHEADPNAPTWAADARIEGYAAFVNENIDEPYDNTSITCGARLEHLAIVDGLYLIQFDYYTLFNQPVAGHHMLRFCDEPPVPFFSQDDTARGVRRVFTTRLAPLGQPGCNIEFCQQGAGRYVVDNVRVELLLPLEE